jgi:hypothetical protein
MALGFHPRLFIENPYRGCFFRAEHFLRNISIILNAALIRLCDDKKIISKNFSTKNYNLFIFKYLFDKPAIMRTSMSFLERDVIINFLRHNHRLFFNPVNFSMVA